MAVLNIGGHVVVESAGPSWHLVGTVKRDRAFPNRLMLTRPVDGLSPKIKAVSGQFLSVVQVTDRVGSSAKLFNVQVQGSRTSAHQHPKHSAASGSDEEEEISFVFQKIEISWVGSGKKLHDDWLDSW